MTAREDIEHYVKEWQASERTACGIVSKAHSSTARAEDVTCLRCLKALDKAS